MTGKKLRKAQGVVAVALALTSIAICTPPSALAAAPTENLTALFTAGPTAVTTENSYAGALTVTVTGYGQAAGTSCTDAFYGFAGTIASPCDTPFPSQPANEFGLYVNGISATDWVASTPDYRDDHTYVLHLRVTGRPITLTFGVGDTYTVDNSGAFSISVTRGR